MEKYPHTTKRSPRLVHTDNSQKKPYNSMPLDKYPHINSVSSNNNFNI